MHSWHVAPASTGFHRHHGKWLQFRPAVSVNHKAHQQILAALTAAVAKQRAQEASVTAAAENAQSSTEGPMRTIVEIKVASLPTRLCLGLLYVPGDSAPKSALCGSRTGSSRTVRSCNL